MPKPSGSPEADDSHLAVDVADMTDEEITEVAWALVRWQDEMSAKAKAEKLARESNGKKP